MRDDFTYRQNLRRKRLEQRRREAMRKRIHLLTVVFSFVVIFVSAISANAIIASAENRQGQHSEKRYTSVVVENGDTVWDIAQAYLADGHSVASLVEEIGFINGLDDTYSIQSGCMLMIPYYAEG